MKLHSIELINFRAFRHTSIMFSDGLNVVLGRNGAGKSSLLMGIGCAVFGTKVLNLKDLVHHGARLATVKAEFSHGGEDYVVTRTFGDSSAYVLSSGHVLAEGHAAVTERLRAIFGTDAAFDMMVAPQRYLTRPFLDSGRAAHFDAMLNLNRYNEAWENLRLSAQEAQRRIKEADSRQYDITIAGLQVELAHQRTYEAELQRISELHAKTSTRYVEARQNLMKAEAVHEANARLIAHNADCAENRNRLWFHINVARDNIADAKKTIEESTTDVQAAMDRVQEAIKNTKLLVEISELSKRIDSLAVIGARCSLCGQKVENADRLISALEQERITLSARLTDAREQPARAALENAKAAHTARTNAENKIRAEELNIAGWLAEIEKFVDVAVPDSHLDDANLNVSKIGTELNSLAAQQDTLEKKINTDIAYHLEEALKAKARIDAERGTYERVFELLDETRGIIKELPSLIGRSARQRIVAGANDVLRRLGNGKITNWDDDYTVYADFGFGGLPFSSLSGGEQASTALALRHTLTTDFLLMDEPTDSLDVKTRTAYAEVLAGMAGAQTILITHDRLFDSSGNIIQLEN